MKTNIIKQEIENWLITAQYPIDAKAALQKVLSLINSMQEEPVSNDVLDTIDKEAKKIWNEINTGHEYSIIDSYNQFYGICMEIAEMVQEEPYVMSDKGKFTTTTK